MKKFNEIFIDKTKYGEKIQTSEYEKQGKHIIVDQGQAEIAGYTNREEGLFNEVPVIIFGDHTRLIKYIDEPFFLGADGVKVLRSKEKNANYKYLYYALKSAKIPNTGYNRHFKWLKDVEINYPDSVKQEKIVDILDRVSDVIEKRKAELSYLDTLIKARFVEMFGDPISNPKGWDRIELGRLTDVGSSKRIFEKEYVSEGIPFYRTKEIVELSKGNSISTELYITEERFSEIKEKYGTPKAGDLLISAVGTIGIIWIVDGKNDFYFKDGNLIKVDSSEKFNSVYMKNLLEYLIDEYKKQMSSGTAYAALTISGLVKMKVYDVPLKLQDEFAAFVHQVDKSKVVVQKALDETQILFNSLMQQYFG